MLSLFPSLLAWNQLSPFLMRIVLGVVYIYWAWLRLRDKGSSANSKLLGILDAVVWFGGPHDVQPTVRGVAERARDIFNADLSFPIILTQSGEVLDGAHRIAKAFLSGLRTLPAIIIDDWPPPDGVVAAPNSD